MEIRSHQDLRGWQAGKEPVVRGYRLTQAFPGREMDGPVNRMRRAAV